MTSRYFELMEHWFDFDEEDYDIRAIQIDAIRSIFRSLRIIQKNNTAIPNAALIEYANEKGFLYGPHEYDFLQNIRHQCYLTEKQEHWLTKINRRIVEEIVVDPKRSIDFDF